MKKMGDIQRKRRERIAEAAAGFHGRIAGDGLDADGWRELQAWIEQDEAHRRVFFAMQDLSESLGLLGGDAGRDRLRKHAPSLADMLEVPKPGGAVRSGPSWLRLRYLAMTAGLVAAVLLTLVLSGKPAPQPAMALAYQTEIGERRKIDLEDGSVLTLGADSQASATFTEAGRRVALRSGEAYLEVAWNAGRPFVVEVAEHRVEVTGTAFNVRHRDGPASVTVHEGQVLVSAGSKGVIGSSRHTSPIELRAGQRLEMVAGAAPTELSPEELANASAWREGWLHFTDATLAEVVRELNLYRTNPLVIGDARAASLRVGGSFNSDSAEATLNALEALLPVTVRETPDQIVIDFDPQH